MSAQPTSRLNYDVFISPYAALPSLQDLRKHLQFHLRQNKTPEEFIFAGQITNKPYSFDDSPSDVAAEPRDSASLQQPQSLVARLQAFALSICGSVLEELIRLRDFLDVGGGNVSTLSVELPPNYRRVLLQRGLCLVVKPIC